MPVITTRVYVFASQLYIISLNYATEYEVVCRLSSSKQAFPVDIRPMLLFRTLFDLCTHGLKVWHYTEFSDECSRVLPLYRFECHHVCSYIAGFRDLNPTKFCLAFSDIIFMKSFTKFTVIFVSVTESWDGHTDARRNTVVGVTHFVMSPVTGAL
jgi:hypothetical protein